MTLHLFHNACSLRKSCYKVYTIFIFQLRMIFSRRTSQYWGYVTKLKEWQWLYSMDSTSFSLWKRFACWLSMPVNKSEVIKGINLILFHYIKRLNLIKSLMFSALLRKNIVTPFTTNHPSVVLQKSWLQSHRMKGASISLLQTWLL